MDSYLGAYELISDLYANGLITEEMLGTTFSYNLDQAYKNKEVRGYVSSIQKEEGQYIYAGFEEMGQRFSSYYKD